MPERRFGMSNKLSKISIILFTLRSSPLSYEEKLKKLRAIGYQSIQGGLSQDMTLEQHKNLLDGLGMEISCLAGGLQDIEANPGKYIEACRCFDTDEVMIGTMPVEYRGDYDGYMRAIEYMNKVGRVVAKEGVYLGYHNHAQEFRRFANGKTGMDLLFDNLDPAAVHFLPDTHWLQAGGVDVLAWIEKCKGRMQYLHVKDYRVGSINYETVVETHDKQFSQIGGGNMPWREIVDTALACGVKAFIVEQDDTYGQDPFECAEESYKTLKACGL
jgi:sugar phosphate isomerase/epimerase